MVIFGSFSLVHAQQLDHRQGEIIICLHAAGSVEQIVSRHVTFENSRTNLQIDRCLSKSGHIWHAKFDFTEVNENHFLQDLASDPMIRIAQFNHFVKRRSDRPNDPFIDEQWQWINTGAHVNDVMNGLSRAWDITTGGVTALGDTIVVAAIDVGVNAQHEDLRANIWFNRLEIPNNGIDDDENGYIDDYRGWNVVEENDNIDPEELSGQQDSHGTEILGTIGSVGNNGNGTIGINWNVKMMNIYFNADLNEADMIGAYGYILEQRKIYNETQGEKGAYVVSTNLSYGDEDLTPEETPIWCAVYDMLGEQGILNCAATANEELNIDTIRDVPTSCASDFLISVTATDISDQRTFAAFGKNDIDIAAPGERIYTTNLNTYGPVTGTSYASPIVAGAVALLYATPCSDIANLAQIDPPAAALMARSMILENVDPIESLADEVSSGGRLNVFNALSASLAACSACVAPFDIQTEVAADVANISWTLNDSVTTTKLEFRVKGDTLWMVNDSVSAPLTLADLQTCQTYEYQLTSTCEDGTQATSNIIEFTSGLCCDAPSTLELIEILTTSVTISWDSVSASEGYDARYRLIDSVNWDTIFEITGPQITLDSLSLCSEYLLQVRTICSGEFSSFGDTLSFRTMGCGPCLDSTYCSLDVQPFGGEWIEAFKLNTIDNQSGYNEGYGDFTGSATTLKMDNSYEMVFTPGFQNDTLEEHYFAWIDYNQDGTFDNDTELVFASDTATADTMVVGAFKVPNDVPEGLTRLRIMMLFEPIDTVRGCDQLVDLGEAEDYCVNILFDSLLCPQPTNVDTANFAGTSTDIVWEKVDSAIAYTIRYRKVGEEDWEEAADTATMYPLSELEECAEYEVQVQAVCMQDTSGYTESLVFATFCSTRAPEIAAIESYQVYPNPFVGDLFLLLNSGEALAGRIYLRNLDGKRLVEKAVRINDGESKITLTSLGHLPHGMYVVTLVTDKGQITRKLIKS